MGSDDSSKSIHVSQYTPQLYAFQCSVLQLKTLLLSSAFTFSSKSWMVLDASYNKQVSLRKETDNKNQNEKQNKRRRNEKRKEEKKIFPTFNRFLKISSSASRRLLSSANISIRDSCSLSIFSISRCASCN